MRNVVRAVWFLFCWWFALLPGLVLAQTAPPAPDSSWNFSSSGGRLTVDSMPTPGNPAFDRFLGTVTNSGTGAQAEARMTAQLRGVNVPFVAKTTVSGAAVARGAARALGALGLAITLADLGNSIRCARMGGQAQSVIFGSLECDFPFVPGGTAGGNGVAAISVTYSRNGTTYSSCDSLLAAAIAGGSPSNQSCVPCPPNQDILNTGARCVSYAGTTYVFHAYSFSCASGTLSHTTYPPVCVGATPAPTTRGPATEQQVAERVAGSSAMANNRPQLVNASGQVIEWGGGYVELGAPPSVQGQTVTRTGQGTGGATWTEVTVPTLTVTCVQNSCTGTRTDTTTRTTVNPDGTTTVNTTTTTNPDGGSEQSVTCGLPGTPPCKIDERGTPTFQTPVDVTPDLTTADQTKRTQVDQSIQPPTFGFLGAPPLAACTPFVMPSQTVGNASVQIPPLNPCGVVDGVRAAMAYIWAVAAVWLAFGMVRRTVAGG